MKGKSTLHRLLALCLGCHNAMAELSPPTEATGLNPNSQHLPL